MQANILEAVQWLVRDTRALDSLVFAFSGHGCFDASRDQERDGILSSDFEKVLLVTFKIEGNFSSGSCQYCVPAFISIAAYHKELPCKDMIAAVWHLLP